MSQKVSVITVCYNALSSIEDTMSSVIEQSYPHLEYIIIDGGSTDGTIDVIRKYQEHISYWVSEPDSGIFEAMNKGLKKAHGEWVIFMNAGDSFYDRDAISKSFSMPSDNYVMIYGNTQYIRNTGSIIETAFEPGYIKKNMPTCHQSFFIRTDVAIKIGFDTRFRYAADYNMVYKIFKTWGHDKVKHIPVTVSTYEAVTGFSMQHENEVYRETLRIRDLSLNVLYGYMKYCIKKMIGRK